MTLKQYIIEQRDIARKNNHKIVLSCCNMIISKIQTFETSGKEKKEAIDNNIITILQQYKKQVSEELTFAIDTEKKNDLEKEISVIDSFLPEQITDDELSLLIQTSQIELNNNKGKIIGYVKQMVNGKADGKRISDMVNKLVV